MVPGDVSRATLENIVTRETEVPRDVRGVVTTTSPRWHCSSAKNSPSRTTAEASREFGSRISGLFVSGNTPGDVYQIVFYFSDDRRRDVATGPNSYPASLEEHLPQPRRRMIRRSRGKPRVERRDFADDAVPRPRDSKHSPILSVGPLPIDRGPRAIITRCVRPRDRRVRGRTRRSLHPH